MAFRRHPMFQSETDIAGKYVSCRFTKINVGKTHFLNKNTFLISIASKIYRKKKLCLKKKIFVICVEILLNINEEHCNDFAIINLFQQLIVIFLLTDPLLNNTVIQIEQPNSLYSTNLNFDFKSFTFCYIQQIPHKKLTSTIADKNYHIVSKFC